MATITFGEEKRAANDRKKVLFPGLGKGGTFDKGGKKKKEKRKSNPMK